MAAASVARLSSADEIPAQQERVAYAQRLYRELTEFPSLTGPPGEAVSAQRLAKPGPGAQRPGVPLGRPAEGWLQPAALPWFYDPLGTARAYHDVVPDGGATTRQQMAGVTAILRGGLAEKGFTERAENLAGRRVRDVFHVGTDAQRMDIAVVNIVHTSYCAQGDAEEEEIDTNVAPKALASGKAQVSQLFLWRRLLHLGPHRNNVHTSLKLCYVPPFNASHILFQTFRCLETGANNMNMSDVMFLHCTLPCLRAAGLRGLHVVQRRSHNIVATSTLPAGLSLSLDALSRRNSNFVEYNKNNFTGAIIRFELWHAVEVELANVAMLLFNVGAAVVVGCNSYAQLVRSFQICHPLLLANAVPVAPAAAAPHATPPGPQKRKRLRASAGRPAKRPRITSV